MSIVGLDIRRGDGKRIVALRVVEGAVTCTACSDLMRPDVERWLQHGLVDIVGEEGSREGRHTLANDPAFFPRLAEVARRHGFIAIMKNEKTKGAAERFRQLLAQRTAARALALNGTLDQDEEWRLTELLDDAWEAMSDTDREEAEQHFVACSKSMWDYLGLERAMFELDSKSSTSAEETADRIRDVLDTIWHTLSVEERAALYGRGTIDEPDDLYRGLKRRDLVMPA